MENAISGFEAWLRFVGRCTVGRGLVESLGTVSTLVERAFGVRIWFVKISGKRWSYIAGARGEQPSQSEVFRAPLSKEIGLVCDSWGYLSRSEQERLVTFLEHLVVDKTSQCRWGSGSGKS